MPFGSPWGNIPPVPPVLSIPSFPLMSAVSFVNIMSLYGLEMRLLPPAAPFMMDQYQRVRITRRRAENHCGNIQIRCHTVTVAIG